MDSDFVTRKIKRREKLNPILKGLEKAHKKSKKKSKVIYPYDETNGTIRIPRSVENELKQLVGKGDKVKAIQKITELTGASLSVSKSYIDSLKPAFFKDI